MLSRLEPHKHGALHHLRPSVPERLGQGLEERVVDVGGTLEELRSMKERQGKVSADAMLDALHRKQREEDEALITKQEEEDEELIKSVFHGSRNVVPRVEDDDAIMLVSIGLWEDTQDV